MLILTNFLAATHSLSDLEDRASTAIYPWLIHPALRELCLSRYKNSSNHTSVPKTCSNASRMSAKRRPTMCEAAPTEYQNGVKFRSIPHIHMQCTGPFYERACSVSHRTDRICIEKNRFVWKHTNAHYKPARGRALYKHRSESRMIAHR
jgi:hypothetical protein